MTETPKHNHMTRDIKIRGKCPACDAYQDRHPYPAEPESRSDGKIGVRYLPAPVQVPGKPYGPTPAEMLAGGLMA